MESLTQLVPFLADPKPEVRKIAVTNIVGFTSQPEGRTLLKSTDAIKLLTRLLGDIESIAVQAFTCLINLSEDVDLADRIVETPGIMQTLCETIQDKDLFQQRELASMLISNLSRTEKGCKLLASQGDGLLIMKLLMALLQSNPTRADEDPLRFLGTVFTNLTQLTEIQSLLLDEKRGIMQRVIPLMNSENILRRRGIIGAIKNCLFMTSKHQWLITSGDVDLLSMMLLLLLPPTGEYTNEEKAGMPPAIAAHEFKGRVDEDPVCRKYLLESLVLLTTTRPVREHLRSKQVYPILRELQKVEEKEEVLDPLFKVVEMLLREEAQGALVEELTAASSTTEDNK